MVHRSVREVVLFNDVKTTNLKTKSKLNFNIHEDTIYFFKNFIIGYALVLTTRFSQDRLENMFNILRSKVISNALQVKNNFKLIFFHSTFKLLILQVTLKMIDTFYHAFWET